MRYYLLILILSLPAYGDAYFKDQVQPFLKNYCYDCHNNQKHKGDLNLESLTGFEANLKAVDMWQEVVFQLEDSEMPPEDEAQPSNEDKEKIMSWITAKIESKREEMKQAAITHLRRLNRTEYDRTVRDLLKIDISLMSPSRNFPADDLKDNFKNNGKALQVSGFHLAAYVEAAEELIEKALRFGKRPEPKAHSYLPPFSKSNNVLKASREVGKDKFFSLVESRSYAFHPDQLNGVPESGYYIVKAKVQSRNRVHDLEHKAFPLPQDQLLRASVVITDPKSGDANYYTSSDRTAEEFELPDQEIVEISGRYWIEKGYTAKIGFPNSVPKFKAAKFKLDKQKHVAFFQNKKGAYDGFLSAMKLMQENGPMIRVMEVNMEGPYFDEWPIASHKNLVGEKQLEDVNLNETIDTLASKAFRRPIVKNDTEAIKKMMSQMREAGYTKEETLKAGLATVLSSPQFFYLNEQRGSLDQHALASRLSYFLWSTIPDQELIELAKLGKLSESKVLDQQILRMIQDPKVEGFVNSFSDAWLELDKLGSMPPDAKSHQNYYLDDLEVAGRMETLHFVKDLLVNNGKIQNFLDSDYTYMNRGLAKFYKQSNFDDYSYDNFEKTPITDKRRGGLLGQMSLLTATANGVDTSPIVRGMWVLKNFFGEEPEAPVGIPAIEPDVRGATTIRELLEKHKTDKNCASCHRKIDPPGFALENFDQIGRWRDVYNEHISKVGDERLKHEDKLKVDANGEMSDGEKFKGIVEFKSVLIDRKDKFIHTLTEKMMTYATGREIRSFEKGDIHNIALGQENFRDLVASVVKSDMFKRK